MGAKAFFLIGAALAAAFIVPGPSAHCPSDPPVVEFSYPAPGVAIHNACFPGFGTCAVDTFYSAKLRDTMAFHYRESKYAVIAYVDSISNYLTYDSVYYRGQLNYVDTFQTEKVWISIVENLKEALPVSKLSYIDKWIAFSNNPFATTYTPLVDTPFVAFFTKYDSIRELGIGPMDGCFFEPTAYTIIKDRVHKKGLVGERMPGVSVVWEDFIQFVGHAPVAAPQVRPKHIGIARPGADGAPRLRPAGRFERFGAAYDLRGRRLWFQRVPR